MPTYIHGFVAWWEPYCTCMYVKPLQQGDVQEVHVNATELPQLGYICEMTVYSEPNATACFYMNNQSKRCWERQGNNKKQQKGKATQHNSPETVIFQRKIGCLGWDSNPRPSALQATPKLPRQLSWLGSNPVYKSYSILTWYTGELKLHAYM